MRRIRVARPGAGAKTGDEVVAGVGAVQGRDDVLAAALMPRHGLAVVVGRPYAEVSRTLHELLWSASFYVLVGILLALLLGVVLSRTLVMPILSLTDGIQRVARGEVAHRLPAGGGDGLETKRRLKDRLSRARRAAGAATSTRSQLAAAE